MFFLLVSFALINIAYFLDASISSVWLLVASQLTLLIREVKKGQVSGSGGFVFMSFLFFGIRPLYLVIESDYSLLNNLFRVQPSLNQITHSMMWASLALLAFSTGAFISPNLNKFFGIYNKFKTTTNIDKIITLKQAVNLVFLQVVTLVIMALLARSGRSLYGSSFGAYVYDLPVPLQSLNIVSVVLLFDRFRRVKSEKNGYLFLFSLFLFLSFTWLMRDVTMFRGFYVFGVMIGFIALLQRLKPKVGYAWILIPIIVLQPFFQTLGNTRQLDNSSLGQENIIHKTFREDGFLNVYWDFYDANGDMNIFDTFVAAQLSKPKTRPYILSWIYAPLHIVPRALWKEKPERGVLQDVSFMYGAPYSPGIAGFFLLDGGVEWMILSMFSLGTVVSLLDTYSFFMLRGVLQACVISILVVNGMFLTRTFLWFYLWQVAYAIIPIHLTIKTLFKNKKASKSFSTSEVL
jgi:hypothetical protein